MEMFDHLRPFLGWLQQHTTLSLFLVFMISMFESLAFVGLLVPGSLLMTAAGILVGIGILPGWPTLVAAILGAIAGDGISYRLGYYFKDNIHSMWPFRRWPNFLHKGEDFFAAHGGKSVFLARFSPVRPVVPVVAGMMRMNSWRFLFSNVTSALLWAPTYIVPGILIGLAALQFPPEVATRLIIIILCLLAIIGATTWLLKIAFFKLVKKIGRLMDKLWEAIKHTPRVNPLYRLLQDPCRQQGHNQLNILVGVLVAGLLFIVLTIMVVTQTGLYDWNMPINQLFRNLYIPSLQKVMLILTYMGDRWVLGPAVGVTMIWLLWRKQWYMACHWMGIILASYGVVAVSKFIFHSPRPAGLMGPLEGNSFPSGHTTITIGMYIFYFIVLERMAFAQYRRILYSICAAVISLLILTRLYLGAHWFTDVLGGLLAGWISAMVVTLSFRCQKPPQFSLKVFNIILAIAFLFFLAIKIEMNFKKDVATYVPAWPVEVISAEKWWQQDMTKAVIYRTDRLGRPRSLINVQWADNLPTIVTKMQQTGWMALPQSAWINAVNHIANKKSSNRLTLLPPLYQGKAPKAIFIHKLNNTDSTVVVLRLWQANVDFSDDDISLWYGTITYEKITKHPLKHSGIIIDIPGMPSPTEYLRNDLTDCIVRSLTLTTMLPPPYISDQQWQGGVLLIRGK
jgi:membrane protein DedA with SNARE-associated domain/membrane-associated phospholipid phosphatase